MLPKRSWQAIVDGLAQHFGEDASLPPAKAAEVRAYLEDNVADAGRAGNKFLTGMMTAATPLRIASSRLGCHEAVSAARRLRYS